MVEMSLSKRAAIHGVLADPHRLGIVDELAMSDRSPSELGISLGIGSNLLAHHLRVLEDARIVVRLASAGDARRRYVSLVPDAVSVIAEPVARLVARRVLFVCTANSARSQLAAAVWNARHEVPASSAGTRPAERVRREAIEAAARAGLDLRGSRTRSIDEVTDDPDLVVTVCDIAHEQARALPADAKLLHWSIPDPALSRSPSAFDRALGRITARVEILAPHVRPPRRPRMSRP
jgi:ArsR family transcriptional regulator, arsenate/arsenite/antimonite-responsive transcriptional repressor / arsenate reductase (thioredoxin)